MIRCGEDPTIFNISSFEVKVILPDWRRFATTFLAQQGVPTLLRNCFEWLHIVPISQRFVVAKNRRCESSRVTSAFSLRGGRRFCWDQREKF